MATTKKSIPKKRTAGKTPARAASRKAQESVSAEEHRIFGLTVLFTVLSLVFLMFSLARYS